MSKGRRCAAARSRTRCVQLGALAALAWGAAAVAAEGTSTTTYAGLSASFARTDNRIEDVTGFANWGNPGWRVKYREADALFGFLLGRQFEAFGLPLRLELDATFNGLSAASNRLDPVGLDETARADYAWIAAARIGVAPRMGAMTVFLNVGFAAADLDNSVTDLDFGPNVPTHVDPDDGFRDDATQFGWTVGAGVEAALSDHWSLRLDGAWMDFGDGRHEVNLMANGHCGPGGPLAPCPYKVENNVRLARLSVIRRFGR